MGTSHFDYRDRSPRGPRAWSRQLLWAGALLGAGLVAPAQAELPRTQLEAGGVYYDLDNDFDSTYGVYWRGRHTPDLRNQWFGEIVELSRFDDDGAYGAVGHVHTFDDRWYGQASIGSSAGGFFWPRLRADTSVSRKWMASRQFVTTVGVSYFDAKDAHSDVGLNLEAIYYTRTPWLFQLGTYINKSDPGSVISNSGYGAVSYFQPQRRALSLRVAGGTQAYQVLAPDRFQTDTEFYELRATWKQWLGRQWGVNLVAAGLQGDDYDQRGVEIGIFSEF